MTSLPRTRKRAAKDRYLCYMILEYKYKYFLEHDISVHCIDCATERISTISIVNVHESIIIAVVDAV